MIWVLFGWFNHSELTFELIGPNYIIYGSLILSYKFLGLPDFVWIFFVGIEIQFTGLQIPLICYFLLFQVFSILTYCFLFQILMPIIFKLLFIYFSVICCRCAFCCRLYVNVYSVSITFCFFRIGRQQSTNRRIWSEKFTRCWHPGNFILCSFTTLYYLMFTT